VLIVAHRPSVLLSTNWLLAINQGRVQAFGEKDAVLATLYPKLQSVTPEASRLVSENVPEKRTGT
jgi:ABC-type protease/lipase transport system fused ATPase/permease subunit